MRWIFILISLLMVSCGGKKILETHRSPDDNYILQVELDRSVRDDEHLGLRLLNKDGDELDYIRTHSGNHMKWAVIWYSDSEIILDSHDVGSFGWSIENKRFKPIDYVTQLMNDKCNEGFAIKYGKHTIKH